MPKFVSAVATETVVVIAGALCAAALVGLFPELSAYIKKQWAGQNNPGTPKK